MTTKAITDWSTGKVERRKVWPCPCGKTAYATRKLAAQAAGQVRREAGENVSAYKADACHAFHIGHTPGLPRKVA